MINKPPPLKCLDVRISIIIPIKGRGFINQGSGLNLNLRHSALHELGVRIISLKSFQVCSLGFQRCVAV